MVFLDVLHLFYIKLPISNALMWCVIFMLKIHIYEERLSNKMNALWFNVLSLFFTNMFCTIPLIINNKYGIFIIYYDIVHSHCIVWVWNNNCAFKGLNVGKYGKKQCNKNLRLLYKQKY